MKKIAFLIPSLRNGGAERVVSNLTLNLDKGKYDVHLILFDASNITYPYDANLINFNIKAEKNLILKGFNFIKKLHKLKVTKKSEQFDVVISFLETPNILNILTKRERVIVSIRCFYIDEVRTLYDFIFRLLIKSMYNRADTVVAVSELVKVDLVANYRIKENKVKVIYNPYDIKRINQLADEEIETPYKQIFDNPTLINIGRLHNQKGQKYLVKIVAELIKHIPNIQLIILGEGKHERVLKMQVSELGIENNVHFLGFRKNPYKFVKKADLFVFTSLFEGFPNALTEAMACGVPVISSDCKSGPREILAPGTDILKQTKEVERTEYGVLMPLKFEDREVIKLWVNEIIYLLDCENVYRKNRMISAKRVNDFSVQKIIEDWDKLL